MIHMITYWKEDDGKYLGYLNDYPDQWTQGETLDDLLENLRDLSELFSKENIPGVGQANPVNEPSDLLNRKNNVFHKMMLVID